MQIPLIVRYFFPLSPKYLPHPLLSKVFSLRSSLNVRDQDSHAYKAAERYISFSNLGVQFTNFAYQQPFNNPSPQGLKIARPRN